MNELVVILTKQLDTAKRALKYYADRERYMVDDWGIRCIVSEYGSAGKKARNALKRIEKLNP